MVGRMCGHAEFLPIHQAEHGSRGSQLDQPRRKAVPRLVEIEQYLSILGSLSFEAARLRALNPPCSLTFLLDGDMKVM